MKTYEPNLNRNNDDGWNIKKGVKEMKIKRVVIIFYGNFLFGSRI